MAKRSNFLIYHEKFVLVKMCTPVFLNILILVVLTDSTLEISGHVGSLWKILKFRDFPIQEGDGGENTLSANFCREASIN